MRRKREGADEELQKTSFVLTLWKEEELELPNLESMTCAFLFRTPNIMLVDVRSDT